MGERKRERERGGSERERERRGEYENREGKEESVKTDVQKLCTYNEYELSVSCRGGSEGRGVFG